VGRVNHLRRNRPSLRGEFAEEALPYAALGPTHNTIVDGCRRTIFRRTITPTAAALEDIQNAADHAPVINAFLTAHILWQMRFNLAPLFITEPKQIPPHLPAPPNDPKQGISNKFKNQLIY